MAVSTSGIECTFCLLGSRAVGPVARMALEAEKRHLHRKEVIIDRTMRIMAGAALTGREGGVNQREFAFGFHIIVALRADSLFVINQ